MPDPALQQQLIHQLQHAANYVLFGGFVLALAGEMIFPRFADDGPQRRVAHGLHNLLLWIAGIVVMSLAFGSSAWFALNWLQAHGVGVLAMLHLTGALHAVLAFLLLDLCDYFFHRLSHNVRWLWLLHAVHHSDPAVDVTTNLRQHPAHILLTQLWKLLVAAAVGVPMWVFLLHETLAIGMAHLHHAAIRWPRWIDKAFAWLVITPRMHWNHHSPEAALTNSNYAVVLSIWDRSFRTFTPATADSRFGLDSLRDTRWHSTWGMLATPWRARKLPRL
ncbi:MAG TPA: sterol desaturase family protein [Burkholderiaceae bacterium]|jgi:sterol desaturase/sphingolipid hydroxylase (fatty acid hydroxylase superfamily)|nr:sterol desaturase family protein [Burkholderiaceae bacterium]